MRVKPHYSKANRELKEEIGYGAGSLTEIAKLSMAPSYFSSKMNIVIAQDLYPEQLEGDEPEPLVQIRYLSPDDGLIRSSRLYRSS